MTNTPSPFDDPDFLQMLNEAGVVHRPGLADELMEDIGPLLAADGFAMDNLGEDVDLDQLNAAMGRAVERRNMELMTPVGDHRVRTIQTLREIALAFGAGDLTKTTKIFTRLGPEPTTRHPSFGYLIGVSLETLDAWFLDAGLRASLTKLAIHQLPAAVRNVTPDLEALARKGRAFQSIPSLMRRHPGNTIARGGAYLVAAAIRAIAQHRVRPLQEVLDELLPGTEVSSGPVRGAAFGQDAVQQLTAQQYLSRFKQWLLDNQQLTLNEPEAFEIFAMLIDDAASGGVDLFDPDDFADFVFLLLEREDSAEVESSLALLHDYVHFRMDTDDNPDDWQEAHEMLEQIDAQHLGSVPDMSALFDRFEHVTKDQRRAAVLNTPLVSSVPQLLEHIGRSHPITTTGVPKRADIAPLAAMIGVDAQGVAKLPADSTVFAADLTQPTTRYVQSAQDLPELLAWWTTLEDLDVIRLSATRVTPGTAADRYTNPAAAAIEDLELVLANFLREYLLIEVYEAPLGIAAVTVTLQRLLNAMLPAEEQFNASLDDTPYSVAQDMIEMLSTEYLQVLSGMGLCELKDNQPVVPEPLSPTVITGVLTTMATFTDIADGAHDA